MNTITSMNTIIINVCATIILAQTFTSGKNILAFGAFSSKHTWGKYRNLQPQQINVSSAVWIGGNLKTKQHHQRKNGGAENLRGLLLVLFNYLSHFNPLLFSFFRNMRVYSSLSSLSLPSAVSSALISFFICCVAVLGIFG